VMGAISPETGLVCSRTSQRSPSGRAGSTYNGWVFYPVNTGHLEVVLQRREEVTTIKTIPGK
jgi:hypothetical protein